MKSILLMSTVKRTPRPANAGASVGAPTALWAAALLLAGCAGGPSLNGPAPVEDRSAMPPAAAASAPSALPAAADIQRARSRWVAVDWSELPGWQEDRLREAWPALLRSCERPAPAWASACAEVRRSGVPASEADARTWLQSWLRPYRVEALDGRSDGLITGYHEPLVAASKQPRGEFRVPLYAAPAELAARKPWYTRQQIDTLPAAQAALRGREIAWIADPLDALVLQIQGSGRLLYSEADGSTRTTRLAFGGHNDQAYQSIGRWLIDKGELRADQASWPGIKSWAQRNPKRLQELLWANPRYVFFKEEPLPDASIGPRGAQGVPLVPGRSIAVDPQSLPYGTPVWLDTTEPLSATPLRRLVLAQDTGSAITGAVRADYFWGWGPEAEQAAGRMKQPLKLWALWPQR
jgi:membrane-bound lytic murein transglycosylase A